MSKNIYQKTRDIIKITKSARSTDAMKISFVMSRNIKIHDQIVLFCINSSCSLQVHETTRSSPQC